jgi:hypothetical protein
MHRAMLSFCLAASVSALAARAQAQSFNIDLGTQFGAPSASYGAAAGQAGFWNERTGFEDETATLVDIQGHKTAVTLVPSLPFGQAGFDHPATSGDDQALMDDYFDLHSVPATFEVRGLAAGTYAVYSYLWAPDEALYQTSLSVAGRPARLIGGAWPGGFREGVTHSRDVVHVGASETLVLSVFGIPKGTFNGLQLVQLAGR